MAEKEQCFRCSGSGKVWALVEYDGRGTWPHDEETCPECSGTGVIGSVDLKGKQPVEADFDPMEHLSAITEAANSVRRRRVDSLLEAELPGLLQSAQAVWDNMAPIEPEGAGMPLAESVLLEEKAARTLLIDAMQDRITTLEAQVAQLQEQLQALLLKPYSEQLESVLYESD